jgi:hypothetical protein
MGMSSRLGQRKWAFRLVLASLCCIAMTLTGCGPSAKVSSAKAPDAKAQLLTRTYLIFPEETIDESYATNLSAALSKELAARGVKAGASVLTGLELDDTAIQAEIQKFNPDSLLVIDLLGGTMYYNQLVYMTYSATLVVGDRRVWKAKIESDPGAISNQKMHMREIAQQLVLQLVKDGYVRGLPGDAEAIAETERRRNRKNIRAN